MSEPLGGAAEENSARNRARPCSKARLIRVAGAGESAQEAVRLLLASPAAGNPVVMLAGDLSKSSGLRKLAEESPLALALISYPLEGRDPRQGDLQSHRLERPNLLFDRHRDEPRRRSRAGAALPR